MTLPNFGIPDPDTSMQLLHDSAEGLHQMATDLLIPLANSVQSAVEDIHQPIKFAEDFAARRLGQAAGRIRKLTRKAAGMLTPSELLSATPQGFPAEHMPPAAFPPSQVQLEQFHSGTNPRAPSHVPPQPPHLRDSGDVLYNVLAQCAGGPNANLPSGDYWFCWNGGANPPAFGFTPATNQSNCPPGFGGLSIAGWSQEFACCVENALLAMGWQYHNFGIEPCAVTPPIVPPVPPIVPPVPPIVPPVPPITPPEPPTQPPAPGSSCDHPIYMQFCTPKKPAPGTCTTDEQGNVVCTPQPPQPGPPGPGISPADNPIGCALLPDGSIPAVGSPEWCSCVDSWLTWATNIGQSSISWFNTTPGSQDLALILQPFVAPITILGVDINPLDALLAAVQQTVSVFINQAQSVIGSILGAAGSQPGIKTQLYIGIAIARSILSLLRELRINWPADIRLGIEFPQIEKILEYLSNYIIPSEIPSVADALECLRLETAPPELVKCWLLMRGADPNVWFPIVLSRREKLTTEQVIEAMRRNNYDDETIIRSLRHYGWMDEVEAGTRMQLYDELPTPADFLHWLQRNVFDDEYVAQYHLMDGFEERYWSKFGPMMRAKGITKDRAALDYAAHWINPAPGELREFLYRLRPDDPETENPFTIDDMRRILREQDVAPYFIERFIETAYRVPALGYLRDMYRNYVIDDEEMKGFHRDLGYSERDSERFVAIDRIIRARIRASESHGYTPSALASAYSVGNIDADGVMSYMKEQGFTEDESRRLMARAQSDLQRTIIVRARSRVMFAMLNQVKAQIDAGVIDLPQASDAITSLGWPRPFADGWVSLQDQASKVKLVNQVQSRIRGAFLAGEIDSGYAQTALASIGIVPATIARKLTAWQAELTPRRKRRSAAQIVNDLSMGELTAADALSRLHNLGYDDADTRLYLADAQRKIVEREAKALTLERRQEQTQAKEVERLQRAALSQHNRLLAHLRRISSPAKMQKWAKLGRLGRKQFYARMRTLEYPDHDIQRYWDEVCQDPKAQCIDDTPTEEDAPSDIPGSGYPPDDTE